MDQVPTELADDVIKNTNLKIAHRIVAADDKSVLGKTMNCTEDQEAYMTVLNRGQALVFSEGDYRPKLVKIPYAGINKEMTREKLLDLSKGKQDNKESLYDINPVCLYCNHDKCITLEMLHDYVGEEVVDGWMAKISDINCEEEFEDICMDVALYLKRQNMESFENCVISKMIDLMNLTIQEKHELYAVYKKIRIQ